MQNSGSCYVLFAHDIIHLKKESVSKVTKKKRSSRRRKARKVRKPAIQYHIGFVGAIHCELWDHRDQISIDAEKQLTDKPLIIDCLILKLGENVQLDENIARHFLGTNLIEYKNWRKLLHLETMLQIGAYGMQYGRLHIRKEPDLLEDMTLTIFTHRYTQDFFDGLADHGFTYKAVEPGVYEITGFTSFPLYAVVIEKLPPEKNEALKILLPDADLDDVKRFMEKKNSIPDPDYQRHADTVAYYMLEANPRIMERLEKEDPEMITDLMRMREREIREQERTEARVELDRKTADYVKSLVASLGLSATDVLKSMGLSAEEQARVKPYLE